MGEDQREHLELMRDVARRFNARFGDGEEVLVVPEHRIPEVGARIMDLQDPTRKMSTTGGSEQGTVYVLDEPKAIRKKIAGAVTDSGSEVRRAPEKPGISNLIEILAAVRGSAPAAVEAEFAAARYGDFKAAVADAVIDYLAPVRERYEQLRADEAALEAMLARGRRAGPRDRRRHGRRRARADGRGPPAGAERARRVGVAGRCGDARCSPAERPARPRPGCRRARRRSARELELDLEVFSGPFDLLLTLVLREEVDLLELELADVVLAYLDHLEQRGELDLETATEFIVLIAALLELKSRLILGGEEEELLDIEPERGRRGAARADARRAPLPRRRRPPRASCSPPRTGVRFRAAPLPPALRRTIAARARRARRTRRCSARRSAAAADAAGDQRAPHRRRAGHASPSASRTCARCCDAAASASTRRSAAPTA